MGSWAELRKTGEELVHLRTRAECADVERIGLRQRLRALESRLEALIERLDDLDAPDGSARGKGVVANLEWRSNNHRREIEDMKKRLAALEAKGEGEIALGGIVTRGDRVCIEWEEGGKIKHAEFPKRYLAFLKQDDFR